MGLNRKPFQGVSNIVRFNWHFYVLAFITIILIFAFKNCVPSYFQPLVWVGVLAAILTTLNSLVVSYYIYDKSDLYSLPWMEEFTSNNPVNILNVNAGFDETSVCLDSMFADSRLQVCDFYNSQKHTEVSIERARKMYPAHPNTIKVESNKLPFVENEFDLINVFMAAHEVRDEEERIAFFKELNRIVTMNGKVVITEHLRDINNFLAFTFGFFHFYSRSSWLDIFNRSNFDIAKEVKTTPFVTTFIIIRNGNTH